MKTNPLVTIYIPCRNYGKYLRQSIESVLSQTYKDFKILIIDDGSNDNSKKILKNYENHKKIKIIYQKRKNKISTIIHIIIVISVAIAIGLGLAFLNHWLNNKIKNKKKNKNL